MQMELRVVYHANLSCHISDTPDVFYCSENEALSPRNHAELFALPLNISRPSAWISPLSSSSG